MFNQKKKYFKLKARNVQKMIWDLEFKIFKVRELREGIRLDRDRALETVHALDAEIKRDHEPETLKELEAQKKLHQENAERFEKQLKMLDVEIEGQPAEGDNPGVQGINDQLAGLRELVKMINEYLREL